MILAESVRPPEFTRKRGGEREWDTPKNSYRKGGSERMDMEDKYPGTRNMPDEA